MVYLRRRWTAHRGPRLSQTDPLRETLGVVAGVAEEELAHVARSK